MIKLSVAENLKDIRYDTDDERDFCFMAWFTSLLIVKHDEIKIPFKLNLI